MKNIILQEGIHFAEVAFKKYGDKHAHSDAPPPLHPRPPEAPPIGHIPTYNLPAKTEILSDTYYHLPVESPLHPGSEF